MLQHYDYSGPSQTWGEVCHILSGCFMTRLTVSTGLDLTLLQSGLVGWPSRRLSSGAWSPSPDPLSAVGRAAGRASGRKSLGCCWAFVRNGTPPRVRPCRVSPVHRITMASGEWWEKEERCAEGWEPPPLPVEAPVCGEILRHCGCG